MSGAGRNPPVAYTNADTLAYLTTGIGGNLVPDGDNTRDIGNATPRRWRNLYIQGLIASGLDRTISVGAPGLRANYVHAFGLEGVETINGWGATPLAISSTNYYQLRLIGAQRQVTSSTAALVRYPQVRAYGVNNCVLSIPGTGAAQVIVAGITQPLCPQNINISCTNVNAPSGTVYIPGNSLGYLTGGDVQEAIVLVPGATVQGTLPLASIIQINVPATIPVGDTLTVGFGNMLGYPAHTSNSATPIKIAYIDGVRHILTTDYLATARGIDFTPHGNLAGTEIIEFYWSGE